MTSITFKKVTNLRRRQAPSSSSSSSSSSYPETIPEEKGTREETEEEEEDVVEGKVAHSRIGKNKIKSQRGIYGRSWIILMAIFIGVAFAYFFLIHNLPKNIINFMHFFNFFSSSSPSSPSSLSSSTSASTSASTSSSSSSSNASEKSSSSSSSEMEAMFDRSLLYDNALTDKLLVNFLLMDSQENVVGSPLSVELALSVAFAGARKNTLKQYWKAVHPSWSNVLLKGSKKKAMKYALNYLALANSYQKRYPEVHEGEDLSGLKTIKKSINITEPSLQQIIHPQQQQNDIDTTQNISKSIEQSDLPYVLMANRVYVFTKNLRSNYQKSFLDVVSNELNHNSWSSAEKAKHINSWISTQTKDKITEIVQPAMITSKLQLLIVNSVYFHAVFEEPFDPRYTKDNSTFYTDYHRKYVRSKNVPMMNQKNIHVGYIEKFKGYEMVMLKYANSDFRLILARPTENGLTTLRVKDLMSLPWTTDTPINLYLPKFTYEYSKDLKDVLQTKMSIKEAFTEKANFKGITKDEDLHIDGVIHKAMVEMNEEGTTAAAVTAVRMSGRAMLKIVNVRDVTFDHPFDFFIWDESNQIVLFAGRVVDPLAH